VAEDDRAALSKKETIYYLLNMYTPLNHSMNGYYTST